MPNKSAGNGDKKMERESVIFDAACKVIREKGYHQARMADIAQEAGISYGLVYHYYRSKSDLFDALYEEWWQGLDALTDRLVDEPERSVEEKLGAIAGYFLDQYQERPDLVHIFITEFSRSSANLTPERLNRFRNMSLRTESIVSQAQTRGDIRSDLRAKYLAWFFLGALEAVLSAMVLEGQPISNNVKKRLSAAVLTMFMDGARPPAV